MTDRYQVINVETGESHGFFETVERARGCIEFDKISDWEIWADNGVCLHSTLDDRIAEAEFQRA